MGERIGGWEGAEFGVGEGGRRRRGVSRGLTDRERVFSCHS